MKVMPFGVHGTLIIELILSGVITSSLSRNEIVNEQELSLTWVLEIDANVLRIRVG